MFIDNENNGVITINQLDALNWSNAFQDVWLSETRVPLKKRGSRSSVQSVSGY